MFEKILLNLPGNYHYILKYIKFIKTRKIKNEPFLENHHILPKNEFPEFRNSKWNIIPLTPREHILAHYILAKALGGKYWFSVNMMLNLENPYQQRKSLSILSIKLYENFRLEYLKCVSETMKNIRSSESEETKQNRIMKWKESRAKLSKEEYFESFRKNQETFKRNRELGLTTKKEYSRTKCNICEKYITNHNFKRHLEVCPRREKRPLPICENCNVGITKRHKCKERKLK